VDVDRGRTGLFSFERNINYGLNLFSRQEASNVFLKVLQIFKSGHPTPQNQSDGFVETTTAQDIFTLLLPNLSDSDSKALFDISFVHDVLACKDNGVQKRGYKILTKLVESGKLVVNASSVLAKVDKMTDGLNSAAKKVRNPVVPSRPLNFCNRTDSVYWPLWSLAWIWIPCTSYPL